ncbi:MAG: phosphoglycolate phosphatase [Alphaproteobacteria bacterium]|nr:phosphoglycolate phosphatase [Alphaproteobacteria bacterium]
MHDITLVFDLDGTLVDTAPDLVDATNHALSGIDLGPVPEAELRRWISFGARRMLEEALAHHGDNLPAGDVDDLLATFLTYYEANIAERSRPYEGVVEALVTLKDRGARLAVCTNKREALSRQLLDALSLSNYFSAIAGRDTFKVYKPHPDHLLGTIEMASGRALRSVMIGDSATDIATAKAAQIPVVAVSFGYTDIPVRDLGADRVIDCHTQLIATLDDLLQERLSAPGKSA